MSVAVDAPTTSGFHWCCNVCGFTTRELDEALDHAGELAGFIPGHMLYEVDQRVDLATFGAVKDAPRVIFADALGRPCVDRFTYVREQRTRRVASAVPREARARKDQGFA